MTLRQLPVLDPSSAVRPTAPSPVPHPADGRLAEFTTDALQMPRFHVWTLGCQMNHADSEQMAGELLATGCAEAPALESADLIVINSCAIRETAEQKVIGRMGHLAQLKRANPGLRVVLTGCSVRAGDEERLARRYPQVDLFLRPDEEPELVALLGLAGPTAPGPMSGGGEATFQRVGRSLVATADRLPGARAEAVATGRLERRGRVRAWLPIVYGCDKTCTYCIVPFSRGPERSRPFDDVLAEARALAADGVREVTLLGQNVNSYGHDLPAEPRFADIRGERRLGRRLELDGRPDMAALLRAIDSIRTADGLPAIPRLRFVTSHPWDLTDRLIAAMAECPSVCEHLHLPVQSGADRVLQRMGRQYTVEAYLALVERLRAAIPDISLTTDVIVGFCGETEAQFEATLDLLRLVGYEQVFAAAFSVRPGTPAARLPDDVPAAEKKRRLNELLRVQEGIGQARLERRLGETVEVLVEEIRARRSHDDGPAEAGGHGGVRLAGRTRQHTLVHLDGLPELVGRFVPVRVERAGAYALAGSLAGSLTG